MAALVCALAVFAALAGWKAATMYIWSNEAWFASPVLNLLHHGYLGTTILESKGTWLQGIDRHTYWIPPVYPLFQAVWYQLFGFSLFVLRSISIFWGAVAVLSWYLVIWKISRNAAISLLAAAVLATEPVFLTFGELGRPDMMSAGLGSLAFAAYLYFREKFPLRAILIANSLAAASCLTHPCGVLYFCGLLVFLLYYDRRRPGLTVLTLIALPYLAGLAAWSIYILQSPADFIAQFLGNISGIASEFTGASRGSGLASPLTALKREFGLRYASNFGWYRTGFWNRVELFSLFIYTAAVAGCLLTPKLRNDRRFRVILLLGAMDYLLMALLDGLKATAYLVHTLPLCAALLAIYAHHVWEARRPLAKWTLVVAMTAFAAVQLGTTAGYLVHQPVRYDYDAAAAFLLRSQPKSQVIAGGEFAFSLGFDGQMIDDMRLGYHSGKRPEFIVVNSIYRGWFEQSESRSPEIHSYMMRLLDREYRAAFHNQSYTIYRRTGVANTTQKY